jgi:predicted DNA binding protein
MFQAELHLQQDVPCVLSKLAKEYDVGFDVSIEGFHDHLVTFVFELDETTGDVDRLLADSAQVERFEQLEAGTYLVTKTSCGGYPAIERNQGILERESFITAEQRVYSVLFFRREDLRSMVEDFREIGTVMLGKLTRMDGSTVRLTDRQTEVLEEALDRGYFEWPREITSEELAEELCITRPTLHEHLRKAQSKLLSDALEAESDGSRVDTMSDYSGPVRTFN